MMSRLGKAVVVAIVVLLVLPLAAFAEGETPEADVRAAGEITAVDVAASVFTLHTRRGEDLRFQVDGSTQFHSRSGEIDGIEDLQPGMMAGVAAKTLEDGSLLALRVAVGTKQDHVRVAGVITGVVPGQGTFTVETPEGEAWEFQTSERTRFRSRDGSVQDIHDLKKDMHVVVVAIEGEDGAWLALLVAVGNPEDRPRDGEIVAGEIVALGDDSIILKKRDGAMVTVFVVESTVFKSRDGSIDSFDDLEVGMMAAAGVRQEDGRLVAAWVAAGNPGERNGDRIEGRLRDRLRDRQQREEEARPTEEVPRFGV
jgi:hypothetical protein